MNSFITRITWSGLACKQSSTVNRVDSFSKLLLECTYRRNRHWIDFTSTYRSSKSFRSKSMYLQFHDHDVCALSGVIAHYFLFNIYINIVCRSFVEVIYKMKNDKQCRYLNVDFKSAWFVFGLACIFFYGWDMTKSILLKAWIQNSENRLNKNKFKWHSHSLAILSKIYSAHSISPKVIIHFIRFDCIYLLYIPAYNTHPNSRGKLDRIK